MTVVAQTPTAKLRLADGRSLDVWVDETPGAEALTPLVFHSGTPASGYGYELFAARPHEPGGSGHPADPGFAGRRNLILPGAIS